MRHTKIIATLGPASSSAEVIAKLVEAGVDVFRLNFSHGSQREHAALIETIRSVSRQAGRMVAVLQDLSGPKIRTGPLEGDAPLQLTRGGRFEIRIGNHAGAGNVVWTPYAPLAESVRPDDMLLLDDGRIALRVQAVDGGTIVTQVVDGGRLGAHKGINAPNVPLPAVGVTSKDEDDLRFGLAAGVDLVALSFVQSARDVHHAREIAATAGRPTVPIIAKLERPEAIQHLDAIIDAADALMVARGDLGLELPLERVPQVQKQVLRQARAQGVPVIIATQVLESMRTEARPTRAEVSDAAGAVDAGADAIMLSGETAIGAHPVRSVEVLEAIIRDAEAVPPIWSLPAPVDERPDHLPPLCDAAVTLAGRAGVDAIIALTREGRTARLLAARRPEAPIFAVTDSDECARSLCLWWGVEPHVAALSDDIDAISAQAVRELAAAGRLRRPATVVIVSGSPELDRSDSNFVRVRQF